MRKPFRVLVTSAIALSFTFGWAGAAQASSHRARPTLPNGSTLPTVNRTLPTVNRTGPWANLTAAEAYARLRERFGRVADRFVNITERFDNVIAKLEQWDDKCNNIAQEEIDALKAKVASAREAAQGIVDNIPNLPGEYLPNLKETLLALHRDLKDARLTLAGARGDVRFIVQKLRPACPLSSTSTTSVVTTTSA